MCHFKEIILFKPEEIAKLIKEEISTSGGKNQLAAAQRVMSKLGIPEDVRTWHITNASLFL